MWENHGTHEETKFKTTGAGIKIILTRPDSEKITKGIIEISHPQGTISHIIEKHFYIDQNGAVEAFYPLEKEEKRHILQYIQPSKTKTVGRSKIKQAIAEHAVMIKYNNESEIIR